MSKATERAQGFLQGVAAKITDPAARAAFEETLARPEIVASVLPEIGAGVLRHDEFSSQMDRLRAEEQALQTWRTDLTAWQTAAQAKLDADRAALGTPPATPPVNTPANADLTGLDAKVTQLANVAPVIMAEMTAVGLEHYQRFNEPLDLQAVIRHPKAGELGIRGAYELIHADRLKAHADAQTAAREATLRTTIEAEVTEKLRQQNTALPYPVGGGDDAIRSPLDSLDPQNQTGELPVGHPQRMVDTFYRERAAATT